MELTDELYDRLHHTVAEAMGWRDIRISASNVLMGMHDDGGYFPAYIPAYPNNPEQIGSMLECFRKKWRTGDNEEKFWQIVDCQEYGWRVDIMWSHHDGDVPWQQGHTAPTLELAICLAIAVYQGSEEVDAAIAI
jgi:hypothetical protein